MPLKKLNRFASRVGLACGLLVSFSTLNAQNLRELREQIDVNFSLPDSTATKGVLERGNQKIDPMLRRLSNDVGSKGIGSLSVTAKSLSIPEADEMVAVTLTADSESNIPTLRRRITDAGGRVTAIIDDTILARVPPDAIETLGAERHLDYLAPQGMVQLPDDRPTSGKTTGEPGLLMTKANLLHERGLSGKGIKVGIIDFGYTGYGVLQGSGRVPAPRAVKAFGKDGGWDRRDHGTVHGAACAEIIHAMAPNAELFLASIGDGNGGAADDEITRAAEWLVTEEHVDVISFSGGGHVGPHNGTALLDKLVEQEVGKGILWVNASGNEGDSHWMTVPKLDANHLVLAGDKPYLLAQAATNAMVIQVSWDDWGPNPLTPTSTQDFDAYLCLIDQASGNCQLVSKSENPQNGRGAPREVVGAQAQRGQVFALFILAKNVNRDVRMHVHLMSPGILAPNTAVGSIGIPATSLKALAVGAVDVTTGKLETYSSQGPTDDNRNKPEVAAPDKVPSLAYKGQFPGTSAACPHVAGFAALLKEGEHGADNAHLAKMIMTATTPLAVNTGAGSGMIDGGKYLAMAGGGAARSGGRVARSASGGGSVRLPNIFGGSVSTGKLDTLVEQGIEGDAPMGAKVVVGKKVYFVNDGMKIGYKADEDCYYLLLHRSSEGQYTLISPRGDDDPKLEGGHKYALPSGDQTIKVTPPAGREQIVLICSREPIHLEDLDSVRGSGVAVVVAAYDVREDNR